MMDDISELDSEVSRLEQELSKLTSEGEELISQNTKVIQDQKAYQDSYNKLSNQYESSKIRLEQLKVEKKNKESRALKVQEFISNLAKQESLLTEFDKKLWFTMVEQVIITKDKSAIFTFKGSQEIKV